MFCFLFVTQAQMPFRKLNIRFENISPPNSIIRPILHENTLKKAIFSTGFKKMCPILRTKKKEFQNSFNAYAYKNSLSGLPISMENKRNSQVVISFSLIS